MSDNLIFLINKLSQQIVSQAFSREKNHKDINEREFKKCLRRVKQKGCDVLLGKSSEPSLPDPCVTDYGGNWSPLTLITDFGRELKDGGNEKCFEMLMNSVRCLQEKEYDCVNELFKLLLLLKGADGNSLMAIQKEISQLSGSHFLLTPSETFSSVSNEIHTFSSEGLHEIASHRKAIQYEESWNKHFDAKFQLLGEFSKKNLLKSDKVSLNSIFTAKSAIDKSQSISNSFVFTDFFIGKNCKSEKNLFDLNTDAFESETSLLDSFVDHPISHKLPSLSFNQKNGSTKSECFVKSSDQIKRKLNLLPESDFLRDFSNKAINEIEDLTEKKSSPKPSLIELKRNSNCSHSFSILYEKSVNNKSRNSSLGSSDSVTLTSDKKEKTKNNILSLIPNSRDIILGLWEQEQYLIKEFRPELAANYPILRMIRSTEYVEDVKYLLTGINSETFKYDVEKNCFNMKYGTCLEDVTPESLYNFSKVFLETGKYYVKLTTCATTNCKNNFDTCTTISQAFWKSIFSILELYYSMVVEIPITINLMALKSCTRDLHDLITTIATICKLSKPDETIPQGGELLTYLLQIAERVSKPCLRNTIFGILQNCCNVYFTCVLQAWLFKGHLEKQNNEFFVDFHRQKMKIKSRTYYNSFYIDNEKIPSFLRGFEENIFNCGKSILFLKLFNPEDKFCQLLEKADYPNISICLSDKQIAKMEEEFKEYEARVIETCGESISIKSIKEEEKEKEKSYMEYVKECKRIQEEERERLRVQELEELKANKDLQNQLLNEQKLLIEAEKERKKLEEERENKKIEEEAKKIEENQQRVIQEERNSIIGFFEDLSKTLEKKLRITNFGKKSLQKILKNEYDTVENKTEHDIMNRINENELKIETTILDSEGNIIEDVDINSNTDISSRSLVTVAKGDMNMESNTENNSSIVEFDENLNPSNGLSDYGVPMEISPTEDTESETTVNENLKIFPKTKSLNLNFSEKLCKTVSNRTIASEEAERNKRKVLNSEFGLEVVSEPKVERLQEREKNSSLSDIEKNRRKVLQSEYDIVRHESEIISVKPIQSKIQITHSENIRPLKNSFQPEILKEITIFKDVELERKSECTDLENLPKQKSNVEIIPTKSDSLTSSQTPSNGLSEDNITSFGEQETEEAPPCETPGKESQQSVLNVKYKNALIRDVEVFHHKRCYQDIFQILKEKEPEDMPCTYFTTFERFLKKSALIPLQIQEKLANDALLKHLIKGENLLSHLRSLRGYFFLNDGEFGRCFTYNIFRSLAKCSEPQQFFERSNLSNIVNEALNYTIHNSEPNAQNLSFQIVKMPPFLSHSSHEVLSPFELSYKVDWPLNIILTEKALSKYKIIFRFLLKLKRINWTLNENFLFLNWQFKNKKLNRKLLASSPHYHKIQIYRHAMTQVIITLDDYIFSNGVQIPWIFFLKDLETTENIDHLYQKHVRYIKDVLTRCFLSKNSEDLLNCIHDLIELGLKFHYTSKSSVLEIVDGKYEHPKFTVLKTTFNEFCSVIKKFLGILKEKISTNQVLKSHYVLIEKFDLKLT